MSTCQNCGGSGIAYEWLSSTEGRWIPCPHCPGSAR